MPLATKAQRDAKGAAAPREKAHVLGSQELDGSVGRVRDRKVRGVMTGIGPRGTVSF